MRRGRTQVNENPEKGQTPGYRYSEVVEREVSVPIFRAAKPSRDPKS
jgi:hypothetical protein